MPSQTELPTPSPGFCVYRDEKPESSTEFRSSTCGGTSKRSRSTQGGSDEGPPTPTGPRSRSSSCSSNDTILAVEDFGRPRKSLMEQQQSSFGRWGPAQFGAPPSPPSTRASSPALVPGGRPDDDTYLLVDRSATSVRASKLIRELTLVKRSVGNSQNGQLQSHLQLTLAHPFKLDQALPSSFTTFYAVDSSRSFILSLSPPSQHLLVFRLPAQSFISIPGVDLGAQEWWSKQSSNRGAALDQLRRVVKLVEGGE